MVIAADPLNCHFGCMAFKKPPSHTSVPDSPDKLFRDLPRRKHPSLFDHQGQILRTYVQEALNVPDVALQLPTGSGKTLVGLLLAEWRRRKNREKVVFLCPTRQLVNQVAEEASTKYGLAVEAFTGKIRNYTPDAKAAYTGADRVAVTTYNSLFNSNPFFKNPDIVIVDDAHASENYISSLWTMRISRIEETDKTLFAAVASVLKQVLTKANYSRLVGNGESPDDFVWVDKIPTDKLIEISDELRAVMAENIGENEQQYAWRMVADHLGACQLYISSSEIVIRPLIPPTWTHAPFADATQRIFMSATLGAGGDLERLTGRSKIKRLAIPEGWDRQGIGRRFFIFPEKSLTDGQTLQLRRTLMRMAGRSLVLSPNDDAAEIVQKDVADHLGYLTFKAADLEETKASFTTAQRAVAVFANRYDGVDFPNDDCRLLFIEGLPKTANLQERFLLRRLGAQHLFNERIQTRVLQAVGRCTRGLNDYSAVVVTGEELANYLTTPRTRAYLHPELQGEFAFGLEQSTDVDAKTIQENFRIFLEHQAEWEEANEQILEYRERSTQENFPAMQQLENAVRYEIAFQKALWDEDYSAAFEAAREVIGLITDAALRGYRALWHYLAGSAAEQAGAEGIEGIAAFARTHYQSAKDASRGIPWLVALADRRVAAATSEERADELTTLQVERLEERFAKLGLLHNRTFSAREHDIRQGLQDPKTFEQAQVLLGEHLGFIAGKKESDASPDPWWIMGDYCIVFEDHAGAGAATALIDATKARQAASHPDWMKANVPAAVDATILPVLVTPARKATSGAMPSLSRVAYWELSEFRQWAERALIAIRDLRRTFSEPGDLDWRARAATALCEIGADASGLFAKLKAEVATKHLTL
jgi:Rad3-related DNA helicase